VHVLAVVSEWFRVAGVVAAVLIAVINTFWPEQKGRR
jgi:hypothetical protein